MSAVLTERGGGRQWPTVGLTRGAATVWITVDGDEVPRFEPLPKRWIVERTLAWISRNRRLARDFERHARIAAAFVRLAMIRLMLHRLAAHSI